LGRRALFGLLVLLLLLLLGGDAGCIARRPRRDPSAWRRGASWSGPTGVSGQGIGSAQSDQQDFRSYRHGSTNCNIPHLQSLSKNRIASRTF
jgi:hypothetical protein